MLDRLESKLEGGREKEARDWALGNILWNGGSMTSKKLAKEAILENRGPRAKAHTELQKAKELTSNLLSVSLRLCVN